MITDEQYDELIDNLLDITGVVDAMKSWVSRLRGLPFASIDGATRYDLYTGHTPHYIGSLCVASDGTVQPVSAP